jgi:hypothetical protein
MFAPDVDASFAQRISSSALASHAGSAIMRTWFHAPPTPTTRMIRIRATSSTNHQSHRLQSATSGFTPPFSNSPPKSPVQKSRRHTSSSYFGIIPTEFSIWGASFRRLLTVRLKRLLRRMITFATPMTCERSLSVSTAGALLHSAFPPQTHSSTRSRTSGFVKHFPAA